MTNKLLITVGGSPTKAGIAKIVTEARLAKGWGKEEAARQAGISSITWKRIEDAERVQDASLSKALAALGLTMSDVRTALRKGQDGGHAYYVGVVNRAIDEAAAPLGVQMEQRRRELAEAASDHGGPNELAGKLFRVRDGVSDALDLAALAIELGTPRADVRRLIDGLTAIYFGSGAHTITFAGDEDAAMELLRRLKEVREANSARPGGPGFMEAMAGAVSNAVYHELGGEGDLDDQEDYVLAARDTDDDPEAEAQQQEP